MKIYLDIDKTILRNNTIMTENGLDFAWGPAAHLKQFLKNILSKHDVYWLTTHCDGCTDEPLSYLSQFFDKELMSHVAKIKPTSWKNLKVDAINLDEDFLWFDDVLFSSEEKLLKEKGKLHGYVKVDLDENPDFFKDYLDI